MGKRTKAILNVQKWIRGARTRIKTKKELEKKRKINKGGAILEKQMREKATRSGWRSMFREIDVKHRYDRSPKFRNWFRKA